MGKTVNITTRTAGSSYAIRIERGALGRIGEIFDKSFLRRPATVAIISNAKVFGLYGKAAVESLERAGVHTVVHLIGDGERFKSLKTLDSVLSFLGDRKLKRTDALIALGGGVVGDLAGFAASVYLRGVPFFQVPTTLLSMIDSSVGGKTGINTKHGKNLVGAFYQPAGVLIDPEVLSTLPPRELTAGFCEAVKQAALSGPELLNLTEKALASETAGMERFLEHQVRFKAKIVASDERESPDKNDARSRKILNFGHTFAHAIEKLTKYRTFKHGEAVGHGIIFAAELSKKLELMPSDEVELLNGVLHRAGKLPPLQDIDPSEVFETFKFDKKNIGNSLQWVLLNGIGKPVIVPGENIPAKTLRSVLRNIIRN